MGDTTFDRFKQFDCHYWIFRPGFPTKTSLENLLEFWSNPEKAFECSVEKGVNCGTLMGVTTGRNIEFYSLPNQVWMCYDKAFSSLALPEMRDAILSRNFSKVAQGKPREI